MQWYVPVIQLILSSPLWLNLLRLGLGFWLALFVIFVSGKPHAFPFGGGLMGGEYVQQSELVSGAVYARDIIKGENDAPILVEYDFEGKEVNVIGEQQGEYADTQIMSSATFNGYLYQKEKIEKDYKNQF
ncbi:hypothetical protein [Zooshikella sp. RANM57]|uniref:hypothetical protein n=1 Tax=Zooshikella sp. RANM57 TaxID=3425863 RepID=UPI003D6E67F9